MTGTGEIVFDGPGGQVGSQVIRPGGSGASLTLGPGILVRTGTRGGTVGANGSITVNQGTISSRTMGRGISLAGNVDNLGMIEVRNGGTITLPATLTNYSSGVLTGGNWAVLANSTMTFGSSTITTNNANILLDGVGSTFAALNSLHTNQATFTISGGRNFTSAGSINNSGKLVIGSGSAMKVVGSLNNTGSVELGGALIVDYSGPSPLRTAPGRADRFPDHSHRRIQAHRLRRSVGARCQHILRPRSRFHIRPAQTDNRRRYEPERRGRYYRLGQSRVPLADDFRLARRRLRLQHLRRYHRPGHPRHELAGGRVDQRRGAGRDRAGRCEVFPNPSRSDCPVLV